MSSKVATTTLQAAALSALSNILAQAISTFQSNTPFSLDFTTILRFMTWAFISTPPNIYWQEFLESTFPSTKPDGKGSKRLSKSNTLKKFTLDQTLSAAVNNAAFIAGISALKGKDFADIQGAVMHDFWPIMTSGWKVWPLVSLLSFTVVPPGKRILFGSMVGLFWGIYLSLLASE